MWNSEQSNFIKCTLSDRVVEWMTDVNITEHVTALITLMQITTTYYKIPITRYDGYQPQHHILIISILGISTVFFK